MRTFLWPAEDGWPYPDTDFEVADPDGEVDLDLVALHAGSDHLLDGLDELERQVITAHYGLAGAPACTMKELHTQTGIPRAALREALGSGLCKLRAQLSA